MIYIQLDGRDNGSSVASCATCCCKTIHMRPGETNLLVLNYAAWSVPIGGYGLRCSPDIEIEVNSSGCPSAPSGTALPNNSHYTVVTNPTDEQTHNLRADEFPVGGQFTYRKVPLSGPYKGTLIVRANGDYTYVPSPGLGGWDEFWYEMTDNNGQVIRRGVRLWVGNAPAPNELTSPLVTSAVAVDRVNTVVDMNLHQISIPIQMTHTARNCDVYRMYVKARAQNCDLVCFDHISCYDIIPGKC